MGIQHVLRVSAPIPVLSLLLIGGCGGESPQQQLTSKGFTAVREVSGEDTGRPVFEVRANGCTFQVYRENLNSPNIGGSEGWYVVRNEQPSEKVRGFSVDSFGPDALQAAGNPGGQCGGRG